MSTLQDKVALFSSVAFRVATYIFLRWFPGSKLVPVIYTLFAVYIPSFISSFLTQAQYDIIADEVDVTVTDVEVEDQPPTLASTAAHSRNLRSADKPIHIEEEVDVEETLVLEERSAKIWRTLLTGLPSPTSALLSLATLIINVGLILAATDFIYRGTALHPSHDLSFARIGYVSDTEAKLLIREPDQSKYPIFISMKLNNPVPPHDSPGWKSMGGINFSTNETDYTTVITIPLRVSDPFRPWERKEYQWVTSNNHSGTFTGAPRPGIMPIRNDGIYASLAAPRPDVMPIINEGKFTFLTTSCILPNFPYNPFDHALSVPGFRNLAKVLPSLGAQFMLFLGDFIYIDVPKRHGSSVEDYRRSYRQIYASPDWPSVGQNLSWIHVLDDHDLANDWDNGTYGIYEAATEPWHHYQAAANPPPAHKSGTYNEIRKNVTYFEFTQGPASFFMLDTRKYRDRNNGLPANSTEKTMLGEQQLADLLDWLARPALKGVKWKVIASSVPFTKNWPVNRMDTWGGYLHERQKILEAMWDVGLKGGVGVVILSGDRHEFAAVAFPPPVGGKWPVSATVNEFSTSPLSQSYFPLSMYHETDDEDVLVKYLPAGNSKFGAVSIESPESSDQSVLTFRLFIDGKEVWSSVLLSPPKIAGKGWGRKDALWG